MATIGKLYLGGFEGHSNSDGIYQSGVCFFLLTRSEISKTFSFDKGLWEVEIIKGQKSMVARCKHDLTIDCILSLGLEYCQKTLDLISVVNMKQMRIEKPAVSHILLYKDNGRFMLREVSIADLSIEMDFEVKVTDTDGNVIPAQPIPETEWSPALRFYRLSQASQDLFEAYRNLFLGLESILSKISPKMKKEGEVQWLSRVLREVDNKVNLSQFVPVGTKDTIDYILDTQYKQVRCKLFHGKESNTIIPHESLNPTFVTEAYENLIRIWKQIAAVYLNIPPGGGVMTYQGFKSGMDSLLGNGFNFEITDDPTPSGKDDVNTSPLKRPVVLTSKNHYDGEYKLGNVLLIGCLEGENLHKVSLIHRICIVVENNLFSVNYIADGLYPTGIDKLEVHQIYRLINKNIPKTIF